MIKILANENFPAISVLLLNDSGFNIKSIGTCCSGISDIEVIKISENENRTIITFDSDYGELIFKYGYKPKAGVIYLRWKTFTPDEPANYLIDLLKGEKITFKNALTVIDRNSIRQKGY